jgi:hypothetical protein
VGPSGLRPLAEAGSGWRGWASRQVSWAGGLLGCAHTQAAAGLQRCCWVGPAGLDRVV